MRILNYPIMENGDMSGALTSQAILLDHMACYSIQIYWTGSGCAGTLQLQSSNDDPSPSETVTHWSDVTPDGTASVTADTGSQMWNVLVTGYKWTRFIYTPTAGTGVMNARLHMKGF